MISFSEALELLIKHAPVMDSVRVPLDDACGRVLRQEIRADRAVPPFDRVMMDGFAVRTADLEKDRSLCVAGISAAGRAQQRMPDVPGMWIEVMTGGPVPVGSDCIVPVERIARTGDGNIRVEDGFVAECGLFIHPLGSDAKDGEVLLKAGVRMGSLEIGAAASFGAATVEVSRRPRITVIPTGDELVAIDAVPAPHQIRQSNGHAIHSALRLAGYPSQLMGPLKDDAGEASLRQVLDSSHWLIFTGAVSMGARDFLPALFADIGCRMVFHGVAQRPGKPAGFWLGPSGQAVVGLPGNPVSALTGLHALVLPAMEAASGMPRAEPRLVPLAGQMVVLNGMTHHLPVRLDEEGRAHAAPTNNSGDFTGLLRSDGFVTLPPRGVVQAAHPFTPWR